MLGLIASYDGENGVLMFHVEQTGGKQRDVQYSLRWPDSAYEGLREWTLPRTVTSLPAVVNLADTTVPVEGRWRFHGEEGWEDCVPMEFGKGKGKFEIEFLEDRPGDADPDLDVMAMVGDFPSVFRITLPRKRGGWKAGEKITRTGRSMERGPGQKFRTGGFVATSRQFRITGLESQVALRKVKAACPCRAERHPRAYMVRTGQSLSPAEKKELLKQPEVKHG